MSSTALDPIAVQQEATVRDIEEVVAYLRDNLGPQITAYLGGIEDPSMLDSWISSDMIQTLEVSLRLRHAYQAARMLVQAFSPETAKAWFFGSNSRLDDQAPAYILRHARTPEEVSSIVPVARSFAGAESQIARVWRVAYVSSPLDFTPHQLYGWKNRFDDVRREYRTLYVADKITTCLREVLQDLRPNTEALTEFKALFGAKAEIIPAGEVTWEWRTERALAPARLSVSGPLVDVDDVQVRRELEEEHAELLRRHDMPHLDIAQIRSKNRVVTQTISRTLYERGAAGVRFRSNLDNQRCTVVFEGRGTLEPDGAPIPLTRNIAQLVQVCGEFSLVLRPER